MPRTSTGGSKLSATLSVRMHPRTRYGLFLLSRKAMEKTSDIVQSLFSAAMRGKTASLEFYVLPDLDELWDPVPWIRLQKLKAKRPGLMSSAELNAAEEVLEYGDRMNAEVWQMLLDRHAFEF